MIAAYCLMEETKEREERGRKKKGGREGGMRKEKGEREKWSKIIPLHILQWYPLKDS